MTAGESAYGNSIGAVFPARAPSNVTKAALLGLAPGEGRTAEEQAGIQILALIVTLAFAIGGGMFTGLVIKMPWCLPGLASEKAAWCTCGKSTHEDYWYDDEYFWTIEEEETEKEHAEALKLAKNQMKRSLDAQIEALKKERSDLDLEVGIDSTTTGGNNDAASGAGVQMTEQNSADSNDATVGGHSINVVNEE